MGGLFSIEATIFILFVGIIIYFVIQSIKKKPDVSNSGFSNPYGWALDKLRALKEKVKSWIGK